MRHETGPLGSKEADLKTAKERAALRRINRTEVQTLRISIHAFDSST